MDICTKLQKFTRKLVYQDGATSIPISILVVVFFVTFFSGWINTMVFSFLPKLVQWFGVSELETGSNVGLVGTSVYIGAFISSPLWGYLSDKVGHRTCVLVISVCCVVTTLAFGCSKSLMWAIVTRFLQGCSAGQVIPLKALLREVCDDTNIAVGMSVLLTAFSVGNIMGPSVGGFTAFPYKTYPKAFSEDGLFGWFPALLPNLIVSTGIVYGIYLTLVFLPTDSKQKHIHNIDDEEGSPLLQNDIPESAHEDDFAEDSQGAEEDEISNTTSNIKKDKRIFCISKFISDLKNSHFVSVFRTKECIMCCVLFSLFAFVDVGFEQLFPILASTDQKYKGMGFQPSEVGTVLMIVSIVQIVFQLTLLPKLSNYFGPKKFLVISNVIQALFCPLLPAVPLLKNDTMKWCGLVLVIFIVRTCVFTGYLSLNILLNNAIDAEVIGTANGVTVAAMYSGKLIAPIACGRIYSWSLRNVKGVPGNDGALGFPLDQFLAFFVLSLLSVICSIFTMILPTRMNYIKEGRK